MQELLKVFFINLVSDIDNMLILGAILRRYSYSRIVLPAAVLLTFTRTVYVLMIDGLTAIPMFRLLLGVVLLILAFKLVTKAGEQQGAGRSKRSSSLIKILALLAATDFLICMDGVIVISGLSQHILPVTIGIFSSLLISLYFLPIIVKLATAFSWINIIAGAFIAKIAIVRVVNDPFLGKWLSSADSLFPEADVVSLVSSGTVILMIVIGVFSYIRQQHSGK